MIRLVALCLFPLLVSFPIALAREPIPASRIDAIVAAGVLKVGSTGDYKPFTYRDPSTGEFSGFDIDQAKSLAQALGVKLEIVPTSWLNLMQDFEARKFDIAMSGISVTFDRQKKGLFSAPYIRDGKASIARCADKDKFDTLADIDRPSVTVIVNPGGTNESFTRANLKRARVVLFDDNTKIFDELAAGKADVMITDAAEARYQAKLHAGVLCAVHPDKPFELVEKAYWIQRDPYLTAFVDLWLRQSKESGAYHAIYEKWFE